MSFTKINAAGIGSTETVTINGLSVIGDGSFGGNVSVAGTLTYEDVTNIDSVGLITARNGIVVGSGITLSSDGDVFAVGVSTFNGNVLVGSGITLSPDGDGFFTGITTTTSFNVGTGITFSSSSASFGGGVVQESFHNDTSAVSGTHNHDALTYGMVWNGSTNAGGSFVINLRGDASTTFDSLIGIGKVTTMTIYSANNSASNYMTSFQIDGSAQTIKYANATTPSAATGSGVDVYSLTILKTAANTYSVFGNFTNFA